MYDEKSEQEQTANLKKIRRAAYALLARRDYTSAELSERLQKRAFSEAEIECILSELQKAAYINDGRYIENYIRQKREKGYGPRKIIQELKARGIADSLIAEYIQIHDNKWLVAAHKIWRKHSQKPISMKEKEYTFRMKQIRFLLQRGFTQEQINQIFRTDFYLPEQSLD